MSQFTADPWDARNKYISVVNDRNIENIDRLLSELTGRENSYEEKIALLKLLEMQRNAMLMYTSCGWYFDNITGIETVQIMHYASRTIQLAKELGAEDFEPEFMKTLEKAPCSTKGYSNGREVYQALIKTASIDLNRVGAHLALSSIFEQYKDRTDIYCYSIDIEAYEHTDAGIQKLAAGRAAVRSNIVLERHRFDFAVLYFGEHNLIGAVSARMDDQAFENMRENLKKAFTKGDTTEVIRIMNTSFSGNSYSLWHLFKDQQRRILYDLLKSTWQEIEASFQHIYEHNYSIMQIMRGMNIPLPKALSTPAEFILNRDLCREIRGQTSTGQPSIDRLRLLADEVARLSLQLDEATIRFEASHKINELMSRFEESPDDVNLLETIETTIRILASIVPQLDLQKAQNIFFALSRGKYPEMAKKVDSAPDRVGGENAGKWVRDFENLARSLGVVIK